MFEGFGKVLAFYFFVFCAMSAVVGFALARWVF